MKNKNITEFGTAKKVPDYAFSPAMALAAKRAAAFQPVFMTIANVGVRHAHSMGGDEGKEA